MAAQDEDDKEDATPPTTTAETTAVPANVDDEPNLDGLNED